MNERTRNMAVGLTTLVGILILITMILIFAGLPEMFSPGYTIWIHFDHAHELQAGDEIHLMGKRVGLLTDVSFTDGDTSKGVTLTGRIDPDIRLPANVQARVYTKLMGKGYLVLTPVGPLPKDPDTGEEIIFLPMDKPILLEGVTETGGGSMIPAELTEAMGKFGALADNLNELIAPKPETQPGGETQPAPETQRAMRRGLLGSVDRLNRTLDSVYAITGDPKNQKNLQASLKNFASFSAQADELTRKLLLSAENVSQLVLSMKKTVDQVREGEGTAGKLLRDPQLYENLLRISEQMEALMKDFRELTKQWKSEGLKVKM